MPTAANVTSVKNNATGRMLNEEKMAFLGGQVPTVMKGKTV